MLELCLSFAASELLLCLDLDFAQGRDPWFLHKPRHVPEGGTQLPPPLFSEAFCESGSLFFRKGLQPNLSNCSPPFQAKQSSTAHTAGPSSAVGAALV